MATIEVKNMKGAKAGTAIMVNQFLGFLKSSIARQGHYVRPHHFPYKQDFKRIKPVFAIPHQSLA